MFNIQEYEQRLKEECRFISVQCCPRGDEYGADTVVELTATQLRYFSSLPGIEVKGKLLASQSMANFNLRGRNMCKEPHLSLDGNVLTFSGSVAAAEPFLMYFFCDK